MSKSIVIVVITAITILFFYYDLLFSYYLGWISLFTITIFRFSSKSKLIHLVYYYLSIFLIIFTVLLLFHTFNTPTINFKQPLEGVIESLKQNKHSYYITLKTKEKQKILGIFFLKQKTICKPTPNIHVQPAQIFTFTGKVTHIKNTKTQMQFTVRTKKYKILAVFYQSKKHPKPYFIHINNFVTVTNKSHRFFKRISPNKKREHLKWLKGYTHYGSIGSIQKISRPLKWNTTAIHNKTCFSRSGLDIKEGQTVILYPKKEWKTVQLFHYPYYLFAKNYHYYAYLSHIKILNTDTHISWRKKIQKQLISLYSHSPYQEFYESVLLARKNLHKNMYMLFQKNDLIPFLVISGLHIDIFITFLMLTLYIIFLIIHIIQSHHYKNFTPYHQFYQLKYLSVPFFMAISILLVIYLYIIDFPQSASRAVLCFILIGLARAYAIKTYRINILFISVVILILIAPYWLGYPLGLLYSTTAVFSIYYTLPIINHFAHRRHFFIKYIVQTFLLTCFIHLFIVPLILFKFHSYNLFAIFLGIPISILFMCFLQLAVIASILYFLLPSLGILFISTSDHLLAMILWLLEKSLNIHIFKIYIPYSMPIYLLVVYYILLIGVIAYIKKRKNYRDLIV